MPGGVELATAYVSLVVEGSKVGPGVRKSLSGVEGEADRTGGRAGKKLGESMNRGFKSPVKSILGTFAGLGLAKTAVDFFKDSNAEARESQKVGAQTTAVIKSTGGAANVTAKQIGNLSTKISNKVGIDDEAIQSGANMLLTFKNVRNEAGKGNKIFDQSTQVLTDMSAAMGTEPKKAAIQLGKALNDPIKGISALSRVGVTFSDKQKKVIKSMVASGNTMGAQKIILKELKSEFGGSAAAMATPGDKARVSFDNLKETIGTALLPVVDRFSNFVTSKAVPAISSFVTGMQSGKGAGGQFASALGTIFSAGQKTIGFLIQHKNIVLALVGVYGAYRVAAIAYNLVQIVSLALLKAHTMGTVEYAVVSKVAAAATKVWAVGQAILNAVMSANPIALVVIAIAALVVGFILAYKHSSTFRSIVQGALKAVGAAAQVVWGIIRPIFKLWIAEFKLIGAAAKWLYNNAVAPAFKLIAKAAAVVLKFFASMLRGLSHVPGFGWAKKAADAMDKAANKANQLANGIHKIPGTRNTKITADTGAAKGAVNAFIAGLPRNHVIRMTAEVAVHAAVVGGGKLPHRAGGGPVTAGRAYVVNEHRQEIFIPNTSGRIDPGTSSSGVGRTSVFHLYDVNNQLIGTMSGVADDRVKAGAQLAGQPGRGGRL